MRSRTWPGAPEPSSTAGSDPPLIFVHYGPSAYLRHTLSAARQSNPAKKIYFLGDEDNRRFCPQGVDFVHLREFSLGAKLRDFRAVFRPIQGAKHRFNKHGGVERWLGFVFERWFIVEDFVQSAGIARFWTFDSDTMVTGELSRREPRLAPYAATQQCRGCCLNGLINSVSLLGNYTAWMISLFRDSKFLEMQQSRLQQHEGLAFNEMDAWQHYRDGNNIATCSLGEERNGEVFDDALAIIDGYEVSGEKVLGRTPVKKLMLDARGAVFALRAADRAPVRMVTLNLSWLPDFLYRRLLPFCLPAGDFVFDASHCRELDVREPFGRAMTMRLRSAWSGLRRAKL